MPVHQSGRVGFRKIFNGDSDPASWKNKAESLRTWKGGAEPRPHFTGGEPFLNYELLFKAVGIARELDIPSTFVETNCYWCSDDKVTKEKLQILKEKGLGGILISVNPFYLEYVPFEGTERGIRIALEVFGENVMIYQPQYYYRFKQLGTTGRISLDNYRKSERDNLARNVELFLMGRAAYRLRDLYPGHSPDCLWDEPCRPPFLRS